MLSSNNDLDMLDFHLLMDIALFQFLATMKKATLNINV